MRPQGSINYYLRSNEQVLYFSKKLNYAKLDRGCVLSYAEIGCNDTYKFLSNKIPLS
jgi:hypothetical protein